MDSVVSANQTETRSQRIFSNYQTKLNTDYLNPLSSRTEPDKKQFIQNDILSKYSRNGITAGDISYDFNTISFPHQTSKHDIPVTVTLGTYTSNGTLDMTLTNTITSKDFTVTLQSRMTTDAKDLTDEFKTFFAPILVTNDLDVKLSFDNEVYFQNYPIHINIKTNSGTFVYTINPGEKAKNFQMTVDFIFELIQIPNLTLKNFPNITFAIDRNAAFSKVAFEEEMVNILN